MSRAENALLAGGLDANRANDGGVAGPVGGCSWTTRPQRALARRFTEGRCVAGRPPRIENRSDC